MNLVARVSDYVLSNNILARMGKDVVMPPEIYGQWYAEVLAPYLDSLTNTELLELIEKVMP